MWMRRIRLREREQTPGEEIANSVSHAVAGAVAVVAATGLILAAVERGSPSRIVGDCVFAATMVLVYLSSTLYHALRPNRAKRVFKVLDHSAILLLVAGTCTPFALGALRGTVGWWMLAVVWSVAVGGIIFTAVSRVRHPTAFTLLALSMGWLVPLMVLPMWRHIAPWGLFWLAAGGLAYTGGIVFFAMDRMRFGHLVWHVCVIVGTACHYVAVLRYAG